MREGEREREREGRGERWFICLCWLVRFELPWYCHVVLFTFYKLHDNQLL